MLKLIILLFIYLSSINCLNFCGQWTQYKDIKCFKVLEKKGSEKEATHNCSQIDRSSTLLTIHSEEEQEFLNNLLTKYKTLSNNVWIGMKYINQSYQWIEGKDTNYSNWSQESVRDGSEPCVQLSLVPNTFGKWIDESCKKPALVVCQKRQEINFNTLIDVIENISKAFEQRIQKLTKDSLIYQEEVILLRQNSIPLGFLYTQLPNQSSPQQLWPNMGWTEVTQKYAGLFFRAEGGGSEKFGTTQSANYSRISTMGGQGVSYSIVENKAKEIHEIGEGWSEEVISYSGLRSLKLYTTTAENRPRNTAIKIWKRIK